MHAEGLSLAAQGEARVARQGEVPLEPAVAVQLPREEPLALAGPAVWPGGTASPKKTLPKKDTLCLYFKQGNLPEGRPV